MHFDDSTWFDYVRSLLTPDEAWLMRQHLTVGCDECTRSHAFWLRMRLSTMRDASYEPAPSDVGRVIEAMAAKTLETARSGFVTVAVMTFDSFRQETSAGFRSGLTQTRYMAYKAGAWDISLRLKNELGDQFLLTGHIARRQADAEHIHEIALVLQKADTPLGSTSANRSGEFHIQYRPTPNLYLYVRVSPTETLELRLPDPELSDGERGFEG